MPLIAMLINLIILLVVLGLVYWIGTLLIIALAPNEFGGVAQKILLAVCALILLVWLLSWLPGTEAPWAPRWRVY